MKFYAEYHNIIEYHDIIIMKLKDQCYIAFLFLYKQKLKYKST